MVISANKYIFRWRSDNVFGGNKMTMTPDIPTLVTTVTWMLLSLMMYFFLNTYRQPMSYKRLLDTSDSLLLGFLALASFTMGVFVTYVLLSVR